MSLYDRFELLGLDRDDGVKTFEAREISTGRPVKVHLFVQAGAPLQAALLKAIERLPDEERQRIIDKGKHEGTPYVVTDRLADYPGLSEWVQSASRQNPKPKKAALETAGAWKLPQAVPGSVDQKFADLFAAEGRPAAPAEAAAVPPKPAAAATPIPAAPQAPPPAKEPGEFTRMFQSPVASPSPSAAASAVQPSAPSPAMQSATPAVTPAATPVVPPPATPGEFTRMFQSPVAPGSNPSEPMAPPPPRPASGPSDFEKYFEPSSPAGPLPQSPAVQQPLSPQGAGGANRVGEFTQMFGKVDMPTAPAAPPSAPKEPGEFTRMFQSPVAAPAAGATSPASVPGPPAPAAPLPVSAPPPPIAAKPAGPGEYTRQFSAPAPLTFGQNNDVPAPLMQPAASAQPPAFNTQPSFSARPAAPAAAPAPPRKNNLPLFLGIGGIALLAILIVLFFAMRPK